MASISRPGPVLTDRRPRPHRLLARKSFSSGARSLLTDTMDDDELDSWETDVLPTDGICSISHRPRDWLTILSTSAVILTARFTPIASLVIQTLTYSLASLIDGEQPSFNPAQSRATHIYSAQCLTPEHMPLSPLMVHELDPDRWNLWHLSSPERLSCDPIGISSDFNLLDLRL